MHKQEFLSKVWCIVTDITIITSLFLAFTIVISNNNLFITSNIIIINAVPFGFSIKPFFVAFPDPFIVTCPTVVM